MNWTIAIITLPERQESFKALESELQKQIDEYRGKVKIDLLIRENHHAEENIGKLREEAIEWFNIEPPDFFNFFDDDDLPAADYISSIAKAMEENPSATAIGFVMEGYHDGKFTAHRALGGVSELFKGFSGEYNHLCPMRFNLVKKIGFKPLPRKEDTDFALRIQPHLTTEQIDGSSYGPVFIDLPLYRYYWVTKDKKPAHLSLVLPKTPEPQPIIALDGYTYLMNSKHDLQRLGSFQVHRTASLFAQNVELNDGPIQCFGGQMVSLTGVKSTKGFNIFNSFYNLNTLSINNLVIKDILPQLAIHLKQFSTAYIIGVKCYDANWVFDSEDAKVYISNCTLKGSIRIPHAKEVWIEDCVIWGDVDIEYTLPEVHYVNSSINGKKYNNKHIYHQYDGDAVVSCNVCGE